MQPGVRTSGRVEFRSASGVTNQPSQRQVITLFPIRAEFSRTLPAVVQPDGAFRSTGDPPGRYIINASSPPGWFWQTTSIAGKLVPDEVIELGSAEVSGLVLIFGQTTNRVSGRVSGADGAPDPDAAVIVFPADSNAWREGDLHEPPRAQGACDVGRLLRNRDARARRLLPRRGQYAAGAELARIRNSSSA